MSEKLLPCPHCGGKEHEIGVGNDGHSVTCHSFSCRSSTGLWPTREQAIAAWNRRSSPSQVAPANPAQVTDALKSFAIYSIEDDEDSIRFSTGGIEIACWSANSPQGIALLKLDASVRAAIGAGGQAVAWRWKWKNNAEMGWQYSDEPGFNNQYHHGRKIEPLYASPQPANPAQVTDAMVEALIPVVRLAYSCGYSDRPGDLGWSDNAGCLTDALRAALSAAIGAGGQAVAEDIETQAWECDKWPAWLDAIVERTNDVADRLDMSSEQAHAYAVLSSLSQPHPADERVVEALREAADRFDEIRVILIKHLEEPQRTAFWKAVNGREFCRHALTTEGR